MKKIIVLLFFALIPSVCCSTWGQNNATPAKYDVLALIDKQDIKSITVFRLHQDFRADGEGTEWQEVIGKADHVSAKTTKAFKSALASGKLLAPRHNVVCYCFWWPDICISFEKVKLNINFEEAKMEVIFLENGEEKGYYNSFKISSVKPISDWIVSIFPENEDLKEIVGIKSR
ncbi:MAG: hypothetical protein IJ870_03485 [Alphaproteobacteria bacterium]|nr:hypothetical protein [Alphaproteobacteria bacterium]